MSRKCILIDARTRERLPGSVSKHLSRVLTRCEVAGAQLVRGEWVEDNSGTPDTRKVMWGWE